MSSRILRFAVFLSLAFLAGQAAAQCNDSDADGYFAEDPCAGTRDCNDASALTHPAASEICDGYDNDCDGLVDDGAGCGGTCSVPIPGTELTTTSDTYDPIAQRIVAFPGGFAAVSESQYHFGIQTLSFDLIGPVAGHLEIGPPDFYVRTLPDLVWTGSQFAVFFVKRDPFTSATEMNFMRLGPDATQLGTTLSIPAAYPNFGHALAWNGSEFAAFYGDAAGLRMQRISPAGVLVEAPTFLRAGRIQSGSVAWNGSEYLLAWIDDAAVLRTMRVDSQGAPVGAATTVVPSNAASVQVVWNGAEFGLAWWQSNAAYFRRMSSLGIPLGAGPIPIAQPGGRPRLAWNGSEFGIALASGGGVRLYRIDASGAVMGNVLVEAGEGYPDVAWDGVRYGVAYVGNECPPGGCGAIVAHFKPVACGCSSADADSDGVSSCAGDCDDSSAAVYPGAPQLCDGRNNDCAGGWSLVPAAEADSDADGILACAGDCDDGSGSTYPGAPQVCDGDNNDCSDPTWPALPANEADADGDGFRVCGNDCDDSSAVVHPGAPQVCDGLNNDCGAPGWPSPVNTTEFDDDGDGYSECGGDCSDARPAVFPGAPQLCDGLQNDCLAPGYPAVPADELDADGDGFRICQGDCDDTLASRYPGATETCNGIDDDCDGQADEGASGQGPDVDADGIADLCDNCPQLSNASQLDADGDTVGNACDNCVLVSNPDQLDPDGDARGTACDNCPVDANGAQDDLDLDRQGDACDNCVQDYNEAQSDVDGDGEGDVCDIDDGLIALFRSGPDYIEWQAEQGLSAFHVYEGDLAILKATGVYTQAPGSNPLAQRTCHVAAQFSDDFDNPAAGAVQFSLVTGISGGVEGSLGTNSAGAERPNLNPCP